MVVIGLTKPSVFQPECAEFLHARKMTCSAPRGQYERKGNVGHESFPSHWEHLARRNMVRDVAEGQERRVNLEERRLTLGKLQEVGGFGSGRGVGCGRGSLPARGYLCAKARCRRQECGVCLGSSREAEELREF